MALIFIVIQICNLDVSHWGLVYVCEFFHNFGQWTLLEKPQPQRMYFLPHMKTSQTIYIKTQQPLKEITENS